VFGCAACREQREHRWDSFAGGGFGSGRDGYAGSTGWWDGWSGFGAGQLGEAHAKEVQEQLTVLGLARDAPLDGNTLRAAFRRCALAHHPDRHALSSPAAKADAEKRYKSSAQAFDALKGLCKE
jgi:hypothetical protein